MIRPMKEAIAELEHALIDEALRETGGDIKRAAQLLGVVRAHMYRRISAFGIDPETYRAEPAKKRAPAPAASPKKKPAPKAAAKKAPKAAPKRR